MGAPKAYLKALDSFYMGDYVKASKHLTQIKSSEYPRKIVLESLVFANQKKTTQARQLIETYQPEKDEQSYIDYIKVRLDLNDNNISEALSRIEAMKIQGRRLFVIQKARIDLATKMITLKSYKSAIRLVQEIMRKDKDQVLYPQALDALIYAQLYEGDHDSALESYRQLVTDYSDYKNNDEIWEALQQVISVHLYYSDFLSSETDYIDYFKGLYQTGQFIKAERIGLLAIEEYPKQRRINEVNLILANIYFKQYRFSKAMPILEEIKKSKPTPKQWAEAAYLLALTYEKTKQYPLMIEELFVLNSKYVHQEHAAEVQYMLCKYYKQFGPYKRYKKELKLLSTSSAYKKMYQKFKWETEWEAVIKTAKDKRNSTLKYRLKQVVPARIYSKLVKWYKLESKHGIDKKNYIAESIQRYPLSQYAKNLLNHYFSGNYLSEQHENTHTLELYEMGLATLIHEEMQYNRLKEPENANWIDQEILIKHKVKDYYGAIQTIKEGFSYEDRLSGDVPKHIVQAMYPKVYWETIQKYSKKFRVDPYLVLAIMREESRYKADSRSVSNALGLMNIMPKTGQDIAKRLGVHWKNPDMLLDPETSIKFGTYYLSWLQEVFKGNLHYIISGYNAGPGRTRNWRDEFGTHDFLKFKDKLQYPETKDYLQKVLDSYIIYKLIY
jgi:soluble lytic murein transglycosylase